MVSNIPRVGSATKEDLQALSDEEIVEFALRAQNLAMYDGLTNLFLRRPFEERVSKELHRLKKDEVQSGAIFMVDIDLFKIINDTLGHDIGDKVLKDVAMVMSESFRPGDIVSRHGGEEFRVWLPDVGKQEAFVIAERVRTSVAERTPGSTLPTITVSVGIALVEDHGYDLSSLSVTADKGLYVAKKQDEIGPSFPTCRLPKQNAERRKILVQLIGDIPEEMISNR